ncbi:MAG: zinc-binding dehydrogenase [Candidatus Velthaea sp.]
MIAERTNAVVFAEAGKLDFRDVTLREPAPDEVIVRTHYSSISAGTERLLFDGRLPPIPHLRYPLVPGYEAVGVVTHAGADVLDAAVGDEVFVGGSMCYTDVAAAFGGQSSHLIKKAAQVVPLHGIPMAHAPLLALAATSLHGVLRCGELRGKRVAVIGMGAIGQFAARFVAAMQPAALFEMDSNPARLGHVAGATSIDPAQQTLAAAAGAPLDVVFECTGKSEMIATCAQALTVGGSIGLLSYYDMLSTPFVPLFQREVTLVVAKEWTHPDLLSARDMIADGRVTVADLAASAYPIAEYEQAYRTAFDDPSTLKVILQWA